jgi:hypothetical protein
MRRDSGSRRFEMCSAHANSCYATIKPEPMRGRGCVLICRVHSYFVHRRCSTCCHPWCEDVRATTESPRYGAGPVADPAKPRSTKQMSAEY